MRKSRPKLRTQLSCRLLSCLGMQLHARQPAEAHRLNNLFNRSIDKDANLLKPRRQAQA